MDASSAGPLPVAGTPRSFLRRLLATGENRVRLLAVEAQEEREHFVRVLIMVVVAAALGQLASMVWTAAIVIAFWRDSAVLALGIVGAVYMVVAAFLALRAMSALKHHQSFEATLDQLRKDRASFNGG
jgi:uncharacterized membrane protein YqjE